ncbi:MAG TPA: substrate-binding domain-containing protein [Terriglobales bacterium]|nr:substrate-binding domain-containing protein [Terriglobales bacterium]
MNKLNFVISLTTDDNDYQQEQAASAEDTARRLGVGLQIIYAENDSITQSQQLLKIIQGDSASRPNAIIFEPVGATALPQVGRAAVAAGMGWVVLNRDTDYLGDLRKNAKAPVFAITSNHEEIGRLQGRQLAALLPQGGGVLYIEGPSESSAARQRTNGMQETKRAEIQVRTLKAQWTEASAFKVVSSWLRLSTSREARVDLIAAQDDSMAMGARKAFQESAAAGEREKWLKLPFIGCDGLPRTGQAWVRNGILAATVVVPPNTGLAIEMLTQAIRSGTQPPVCKLTVPTSFPSLEALAANRVGRGVGTGSALS